MIDDLIFKYKMLNDKQKQRFKNAATFLLIALSFLIHNHVYAGDREELIKHLKKLKYPDHAIKRILNTFSDEEIKSMVKYIKEQNLPVVPLHDILNFSIPIKEWIRHEIRNIIEGYRDFYIWVRGLWV
ncbi:hypothetical protein Q3V94_09300 [Caloramator sp. CAR-1]|uniref:hypothetical protein n=1 Tax=Caloramator sp. CAR-1 TaxID=3062777 RepID=UPI0026E1AACA|nr:hypothetical protein [Caloramator sp. CAR-1]MDO6355254.1 hypothetical protein [Caloramator sp. CAR-1]